MAIPSASAAGETNPLPPIAQSLLALAPLRLPNRREPRHAGDDLCVALADLTARDQAILTGLYQVLTELGYTISGAATGAAQKWADVRRWTQRHDLDILIDEVREFGVASQARNSAEGLARAVHDLRGGALSALLGRLQLLDRLPRNDKEITALFVLTRDHLKIMRNALTGLDDSRRLADRAPESHAMSLTLERWHASVTGLRKGERPVRLSVDCRYEGALTECGLESAAIDSIFYNLANNACRHCAGERLEMSIFPVPDLSSDCLRFVLSNEVGESDAEFLRALLEQGADSADQAGGQGLAPLFAPAASSAGSGSGLMVVAELVTDAFGLHDSAEALRERYVGAVLDGCIFRVWFHWPSANSGLPQKPDDCPRPAESLNEE